MSTRDSPPATTAPRRWLLFARVAWVVVAVLALGVFVASVPSYVSNVLRLGQADWMGAPVEGSAALVFVFDLLGVLASFATCLVCLILAVVLFWRRSEEWMVVFISSYLLLYGTLMAGPLERAQAFYAWWSSSTVFDLQTLFLTTPTVALIAFFPDGRLVPHWTRWLVLSSIPLVLAIFYLPPFYWGAFLLLIVLGSIYAQTYRYRHVSTPAGRQQTKWVMFGFLLWWMLMAVLFVPYSLELNLPADSPLPWWTLISSSVWWLSLAVVPLSFSIAVLRYRLYDIDVIINRTLVYGSLTVMLGLAYFGSVAAMQYVFRALIGHEDPPQLTIVVSTLVIAALFSPLRRRIQFSVDRRFYRRKYDARKSLEAFSARLRDETNLDSLNTELILVVRETMQPEHALLWLRPDTVPRERQSH